MVSTVPVLLKNLFKVSLETQGKFLVVSLCKNKINLYASNIQQYRVNVPFSSGRNRRISRKDQTKTRPNSSRETLNPAAPCPASGVCGSMV
jgi:hypothetical protein